MRCDISFVQLVGQGVSPQSTFINVTDPAYDDYSAENEPDLGNIEYQEIYLQDG